jgi:hypothetical protein
VIHRDILCLKTFSENVSEVSSSSISLFTPYSVLFISAADLIHFQWVMMLGSLIRLKFATLQHDELSYFMFYELRNWSTVLVST